ncbi:ATP-binding protein [Streptomyces sp. W16]|uniref:ATP-binding protein n=1 Tax=Streptomyces sp. W16 TaxID=3076631 RepID=UPI00295B6C9E|nr:ATP-binding protein [Streptomyces sp. W16]MDV9169828.1 ATP-binding protein [Streptomyces sp. W16]
MGRGSPNARPSQGGEESVTANSTPGARTETVPVEWCELQRVPPHGLGRPLCTPPRTLPYLRRVWSLSGRSERTPREARDLITRTCHGWRVPRQVVDSLELIVSELVTNAVTHGDGDTVTVAVALTEHAVWVVVADRGPRAHFEAGCADDEDEHGRGLFLVEALASRYEIRPSGPGTAVMACLHTDWREMPPGVAGDVTHSSHEPAGEEDTDVPRSHS